jgi:glycosyltransferase involved in cell wall biosynthesis
MKPSVIIPVYNEEQNIGEVLRRIQAVRLPVGIDKEIIVVDDGSTNGTARVLGSYKTDEAIKVHILPTNYG